jgi:hypothetical protein
LQYADLAGPHAGGERAEEGRALIWPDHADIDSRSRHAKRHLSRWSRINPLVGNAESIPAPDASY